MYNTYIHILCIHLSKFQIMAHRRGVGVGAIHKKKESQARFKEKGSDLATDQLRSLSSQLEAFTSKLEEFASKHRHEIKKNPQFRKHFQEMCASAGVDPLASSKGFWAEKLGVGDFYYELGVQIVEVCMASSHINGGMMTLDELRSRLVRSRSKTRKEAITLDDMLRAIEKLKLLGSGFSLIPLGSGRYLVQSVPGEFNMDHTRLLQLAEENNYVTVEQIMDRLRWDENRTKRILDHLIREGLAWVDLQATDTPQYWLPSLFIQQYSNSRGSSESGGR